MLLVYCKYSGIHSLSGSSIRAPASQERSGTSSDSSSTKNSWRRTPKALKPDAFRPSYQMLKHFHNPTCIQLTKFRFHYFLPLVAPVISLHLLHVCLMAMVAQIMFGRHRPTVSLNLNSIPSTEPWLFGLALACDWSSQATRPL